MSEQQLIKKEPTSVEYVPYGAQDKIKMTVSIVQNLIAVKTKTGKTCSDRDAIKFLAMCQAKRMNPFEGDCFLIGYEDRSGIPNFALVTAHQTYLKRAELHPEFDGMKSGILVRDENGLKELEGDFYEEGQKIVGGWATVFFKNRKQPMHKRLRLARFQKSFGIWQEDPAGMICKCAEADALRSSFPTMLGGMYLREEIEAIPSEPKFAKPIFEPAKSTLLENGHSSPAQTPPAQTAPQSATAGSAPAASTGEPDWPTEELGEPEPKPLLALRSLLKMRAHKEGAMLDYWAASGQTDGSFGSLEEVQMSKPDLVAEAVEKFAQIEGLLPKKGGAK